MLTRITQLCLGWMRGRITKVEFLDEMALTLMRASLKKVSS